MSATPTDAAIIALVGQALIAARARSSVEEHSRNGSVASDGHPGATLDLSHRNIVRIPQGVIELIKDELERSGQKALGHPPAGGTEEGSVLLTISIDYAGSLWPTID